MFSPYHDMSETQTPGPILDWMRQLRSAFTSFIKIDVSGATDKNLTTDQSYSAVIEFTGALTANINVIVASLTKSWVFFNNTTGAFTLTVKPATGTGIAIGQGKRAVLYFDGTNVVRASPDT